MGDKENSKDRGKSGHFQKYYSIKGNGVAHMKIREAASSKEFKDSVKRLVSAKLLTEEKS